jgi:hydroxymethylpyrimidine pyrophosphatase-like HAD family hydrolase
MNRLFIFTDIDDSLFSSREKVPENMESIAVAKNKDGDDVGFATLPQIQLEEILSNAGTIIPVTGRNKDTLYLYKRNWRSYQIASHGAVVLNTHGAVDQEWIDSIKSEIEMASEILPDILEEISRLALLTSSNGRSRIIVDQGIPCYFCAKYDSKELLDTIENECIFKQVIDDRYQNWRIHRNGNNVAFLPPYASKERATAFVKNRLGINANDLTIGIGDSVSDLGFMGLCGFQVIPSKSQIHNEIKKLNI